ncbi:hypothetical protein V6N12_012008 [Hibiscus sabdariffa]|uniref:Uncharacterized protein n=1 Tax=Hibiscus sabdariffa TaxID=183260 RepID=A0ABR2CGV0_9ROSI
MDPTCPDGKINSNHFHSHGYVFCFDCEHPDRGWEEAPSMLHPWLRPVAVAAKGKIYAFKGSPLPHSPTGNLYLSLRVSIRLLHVYLPRFSLILPDLGFGCTSDPEMVQILSMPTTSTADHGNASMKPLVHGLRLRHSWMACSTASRIPMRRRLLVFCPIGGVVYRRMMWLRKNGFQAYDTQPFMEFCLQSYMIFPPFPWPKPQQFDASS